MSGVRRSGTSACGRLAVVLAGQSLPIQAWAHAQIQGMGDFSGGLLHPLLTPAHLLILLALGLWLGQQPPLQLHMPMLLFAPLSAAGLGLTLWMPMPPEWQAWLAAVALGIAILVVSAARLPRWAALPIFAMSALAIGLDSGLEAASSTTTVAITLLGTWISVNLCIVNFAYYTSLCPQHKKWVQTGIRVAGSWIAAICLLFLAFSLRA